MFLFNRVVKGEEESTALSAYWLKNPGFFPGSLPSFEREKTLIANSSSTYANLSHVFSISNLECRVSERRRVFHAGRQSASACENLHVSSPSLFLPLLKFSRRLNALITYRATLACATALRLHKARRACARSRTVENDLIRVSGLDAGTNALLPLLLT